MKKKLGLLAGVLTLAFIPLSNPAGAAADPQATMADTCWGQHPTIIKWTYDKTIGKRRLVGTPGDDVIIGTDGADQIDGNGGSDLICARGGNDTVSYNPYSGESGGLSHIDLGGGDDYLQYRWIDNGPGLLSVYVLGGPGYDTVAGANANSNFFDGGAGDFNVLGGRWINCMTERGSIGTANGCESFNNVTYPATRPYVTQYKRAATTTTTTNPPATPVTTTTR